MLNILNIPIIDKMFGKKYQKFKYRSFEDFLTWFPFVSQLLNTLLQEKGFLGIQKNTPHSGNNEPKGKIQSCHTSFIAFESLKSSLLHIPSPNKP